MGVEGLVFRRGVNAVEVRGQDESDGEKSPCTGYLGVQFLFHRKGTIPR